MPSLTRHAVVLIGFFAFSGTVWGTAAAGTLVDLNVSLVPALKPYLFLFKSPPYLALALDKAGLPLSHETWPTIVDRATLQLERKGLYRGSVQFKEVQNEVLHLEGQIRLGPQVLNVEIPAVIELDLSPLAKGYLHLRISSPMAAMCPKRALEALNYKVKSLVRENNQLRLAEYLEKVKGPLGPEASPDVILEAILFDAYNGATKHQGIDRGEPRTENTLLLALLLIWLVALPLGIGLVLLARPSFLRFAPTT